MTPDALAMESTRLTTLAERHRLERLQKELDDRARRQPSSSRHKRRLFPSDQPWKYEVLSTSLQNLVAATRIADSIQPSGSTAGEGIRQIQALLKTMLSQNAAVSQSEIASTARPCALRPFSRPTAHSALGLVGRFPPREISMETGGLIESPRPDGMMTTIAL
jgi:hypothetical protein